MQCPKCNSQISDQASFCPKCGTQFSQQAAQGASQGTPTYTYPAQQASGTASSDGMQQYQPQYQNQYQQQYAQQQYQQYTQPTTANGGEVMTVGEWALTIFLTCIPLVGIILLFVWGFGSSTPVNKANFAKGYLVIIAIMFVLSIVLSLLGLFSLSALVSSMN